MCGDDWDRINAGILYVPEARCDFACPGNETDVCGGLGTISYYTTSDMPSWSQGVGIEAGSYDFLIGGVVIPLITQVGVHGKVIMVEKAGTGPPNSTGAYELDMSQINNGMDAAWREMYGLRTDVFCAAGVTLPDKGGRVLNVGGWSGDSTYGVRLYWPDGSDGVEGERDWEENFEELSLLEGRWYPTAMIMANGSVLVVGGQEGKISLTLASVDTDAHFQGRTAHLFLLLRFCQSQRVAIRNSTTGCAAPIPTTSTHS